MTPTPLHSTHTVFGWRLVDVILLIANIKWRSMINVLDSIKRLELCKLIKFVCFVDFLP